MLHALDKPYIVGVDLGGTNVRAAVTDRDGKILGEGREPSLAQEGVDATIQQIIKAIGSAVTDAGVDISQIAGAGMGVPGSHKSKEGIVLWSPNFKDWHGVQLLAPIREELGIPVFMGNDVNVAALGEFNFGAGRDVNSLVMLTLGTGIGGGIILDGKLVLGSTDAAAEIGHSIIMPNGPECSCGRHGCLESLAGKDAIIERAARKIQMGRKSTLIRDEDWPLWEITPAEIAQAAQEGDEVAIETMSETAYYVGIGIANAINVLNPEMVIVGGGISLAGDVLWGPLLRTVNALALTRSRRACQVVPAKLGDDAGVMGGVTLVLQELE
ncbi:MAG TPA: ROK family protein [Armatimonadota bacterium]|nr:ROK family protein [Armatimonadota bacterium]HOP79130.1 ROK family protein [Armatimonadota bacterium]HPP74199.1 ROK family protein [Armatimonadota bacterium]